jgi:hypothetical protein
MFLLAYALFGLSDSSSSRELQVYHRSLDSLPFGFSLVRSWIRGRASERRAVVVAEPVEERAVTELGFEVVKGGGGASAAKEEVGSAMVVDGAAR